MQTNRWLGPLLSPGLRTVDLPDQLSSQACVLLGLLRLGARQGRMCRHCKCAQWVGLDGWQGPIPAHSPHRAQPQGLLGQNRGIAGQVIWGLQPSKIALFPPLFSITFFLFTRVVPMYCVQHSEHKKAKWNHVIPSSSDNNFHFAFISLTFLMHIVGLKYNNDMFPPTF